MIEYSKRLFLSAVLFSCTSAQATPELKTCPASNDRQAWARCADSVRHSGDLPRAGEYYLDLFVASRTDSRYQAVRLSFLLSDMMEIAVHVPEYRQQLIELISENESAIREGDAPYWRYSEWYKLVGTLKDDPYTHRISFFDAIEESGAGLLFQLVMFDDLTSAHRWEAVEEALMAKANIAAEAYAVPNSIPGADSEIENKALDAYIEEFSVVEAGLRALERDKEAESVAVTIKQAIARRVYLASALTPTRVIRKIKNQGARETLHEIRATRFEEFCAGVESGAHAWMEIALMLKSQADAEASRALHQCIARAIPFHATAILSATQLYVPISIEDVCMSFTQSEPDDRLLALNALAAVQEHDLQPLAQQCVEMIHLSDP